VKRDIEREFQMSTVKLGLTIFSVGLFCSACSAEALDGAERGEPSFDKKGEAVTIQEFKAGEEEVSFLAHADESGEVTLILSESLSAFAKGSLADRAAATAGHPLTMLEVFRALAPKGLEPDARLVASHAKEARDLQRADDQVELVTIDLDKEIEKSVASCESYVYDVSDQLPGYNYFFRGAKTSVSGGQSACLNNDCGYYTEGQTRAGTCNETATAINGRASWGYKNTNNGAWLYTPDYLISGFSARRFQIVYTAGNPKRMAAQGASNGTVYHLRSGVLGFQH
jgi:hypothetical protein